MVNTSLLESKIKESGVTKKFLNAKLGMTHPTLDRKISNKSEFTLSEARKLTEVLHLTEADVKKIFWIG